MPESATLRLFFALWPGEGVREALWQASRQLVRASGGKPVPRENLHLTLAFLGSVPEALLPALREAAASLALPGFSVTLDQAGYWPRPRVAWLAPTRLPPALPALVSDLWRAMAGFPVEPDTRPYRPHLTLARKVSRPGPLVLSQPVHWPVSEFCLVRSVSDRAGARYEPLARYHLLTPAPEDGSSGESGQHGTNGG